MAYEQMSKDILAAVGGKENVDRAIHCATRLRLFLKDESKVDKAKVKSRYTPTLDNAYDAIQLSDRAYLFDNSNNMKMIAEVDNKVMTLYVDEEDMPNWFVEYIINKIKS